MRKMTENRSTSYLTYLLDHTITNLQKYGFISCYSGFFSEPPET